MNQTEIDSLALASPELLELDVGVRWLAANDAAVTHHPGPARDFLHSSACTAAVVPSCTRRGGLYIKSQELDTELVIPGGEVMGGLIEALGVVSQWTKRSFCYCRCPRRQCWGGGSGRRVSSLGRWSPWGAAEGEKGPEKRKKEKDLGR